MDTKTETAVVEEKSTAEQVTQADTTAAEPQNESTTATDEQNVTKAADDAPQQRIEQLTSELKSSQEEAELFKAKYAAIANGAKAEAVDDLINLCKGKVTDGKTFDEVIKETLDKYPSFKQQATITTGARTQGDSDTSKKDPFLAGFKKT